MAVKGTIEILGAYTSEPPPQTTNKQYLVWSGYKWEIGVHGSGAVSCTVVSPRTYEKHQAALVAAKRQAKRLGIDVTEGKGEMKAYKIDCRDGDHGQEVVFAETRNGARRQASREVCDCEFIDIKILRAPDFDELSPGPVTPKDYFNRGWTYFCRWCESTLYDEDEHVHVGGNVFCDRKCVIAERKSMHPTQLSHESIITACKELDKWLSVST